MPAGSANPDLRAAEVRHEALRTEALRRIKLIEAALNQPATGRLDWGHVGDMTEVIANLKEAGRWAGVAE
jgi:hypothetical protein